MIYFLMQAFTVYLCHTSRLPIHSKLLILHLMYVQNILPQHQTQPSTHCKLLVSAAYYFEEDPYKVKC